MCSGFCVPPRMPTWYEGAVGDFDDLLDGLDGEARSARERCRELRRRIEGRLPYKLCADKLETPQAGVFRNELQPFWNPSVGFVVEMASMPSVKARLILPIGE